MTTTRHKVELEADTRDFQEKIRQARIATSKYNKMLLRAAQGSGKLRTSTIAVMAELRKTSAVTKGVTSDIARMRSKLKAVRTPLERLANGLASMRGVMLMVGLGMLFFGMAMKRLFVGILRSTVSTFNQIMESSDMLGTATQRLAVHWEFLKFVIGSAINRFLEPLMPLIVKIVNSITRWVDAHPGLTAKILILGAALGGFLFILGTLVTPIAGLITNFGFMIKKFAKLKGAVQVLITFFSGLGVVALLLLSLVVIVAMGIWMAFKDNFLKIRTFIEMIWDGIKQIIGGIVDVIKGIMKTIVGIFEGDWGKVKEGIGLIFKGIVKILVGFVKLVIGVLATIAIGVLKVLVNILKLFWDALKFGAEQFISFITNPLDFVINKIRAIIEWAKKAWNWLKKIVGGGEDNILSTDINTPSPLGDAQLAVVGTAATTSIEDTTMNIGDINLEINTTGEVDGEEIGRQIMDEIKRYTNIGGITND